MRAIHNLADIRETDTALLTFKYGNERQVTATFSKKVKVGNDFFYYFKVVDPVASDLRPGDLFSVSRSQVNAGDMLIFG